MNGTRDQKERGGRSGKVRWLELGLAEALQRTLANIVPLDRGLVLQLDESVDRIVREDLYAVVDSPSVDASLKDGYAVIAAEIATAASDSVVTLALGGFLGAGSREKIQVRPGTAVRILTGAKIPDGADAVVAEEFVKTAEDKIMIANFAEPGRNILLHGTDVAKGSLILRRGERVTPGKAGRLAAAGISQVPVFDCPRVAIVATGDEVVAPGQPLPEGKLYASNLTTLAAWCKRYGMRAQLEIVPDDRKKLACILEAVLAGNDAVITSGGAWTGDRDMVVDVLSELGWQKVFHRIRIGPGKAVGFGLLREKPIFVLPGGPPSNLIGFLQIALPGLLRLSGSVAPGLPRMNVRLAEDLSTNHKDWTQFIFGVLEKTSEVPIFRRLQGDSRLGAMAEAQAVVAIAEGSMFLQDGAVVSAQLLG